ncbi:MAG: DUF5819 family protein, partial [Yaniella sp.]|nr:DUF5819 family protein [Yaniella sp.]
VPTQEQRRRLRALHPVAKILAQPVIPFVVVHTLLIAMWVAPMTPAREQFGNDNLQTYVMPWFEQDWSIFAPNPRRTAVTFEVRAVYTDSEGTNNTTPWVDLVALEDDIVAGNLAGPRTAKLTRRLADRMHSARSNMNDEQLDWLAANYFLTPIEQLRSRLLDVEGGTGTHHVDRYLQADVAATYIATAVAELHDPVSIERVQYQTSSRQLPTWENRHDDDLDDRSRSYRTYGWRAPADLSEQELEYFGAYLNRLDDVEQSHD